MSEEQSGLDRALEILREYDRLRSPGVVHTNSGPPFCIPTGEEAADQDGAPQPDTPPDGDSPATRNRTPPPRR
jgi:hypothetical protein